MPPSHRFSAMPGSLTDDSADESGVSAQLYSHSPHGSVYSLHLPEHAQTIQTADILFAEEGPGSPMEGSQHAPTPRLPSPDNNAECSQHAAPYPESPGLPTSHFISRAPSPRASSLPPFVGILSDKGKANAPQARTSNKWLVGDQVWCISFPSTFMH